MKRYSIVRVEQQCPFSFEKNDKKAFLNRCLKSNFQCNDCYGDTKEQLIAKVKQVIRQIADIEGDDKEYKYWRIAVGIVEFLGVE